jgi:competence protein ComEC
MFVFLSLLAIVSGVYLLDSELFFIGISLSILTFYLFLRFIRNKKRGFWLILFFFLSIALSLFPREYFFIDGGYYLVIEERENYCILTNLLGKFYLPKEDLDLRLFDLVKIDGDVSRLSFTTLESEFDFARYLNVKGVDSRLYIAEIKKVIDFPMSLSDYKIATLSRLDDPWAQEIVGSLLFSLKEEELSENLSIWGVVILFSSSGLLLQWSIYWIKKFFNLFFYENNAFLLTFLLFLPYIFVNIDRFSTFRVAVLLSFRLVAKGRNKVGYDRLSSLAIPYIICLLLEVRMAMSVSFYLPFLLSFAFKMVDLDTPNLTLKIVKKSVLMLSIIFPFSLSYSNSFNPLGFSLSMLTMPITKFFYLSSLGLFYGLKLPFLESAILGFYNFFAVLGLEHFAIYMPPFDQYMITLYFAIILVLTHYKYLKIKRKVAVWATMLTTFLSLYTTPVTHLFYDSIHFINIGQGDAILVSDDYETYLIDTGGLTYKDVATAVLIPFFRKNKIYRIDHVFITHDDNDHSGGLSSLVENFDVGGVIRNDSSIYFYDYSIDFYDLNIYKDSTKDENDRSLILYFNLGTKDFLLMGDASEIVERKIIEDNPDLNVDILKLGHHGSTYSSSLEFLKWTSPEEAVIMCGKNNYYGHPHERVIEDLKRLDIPYKRTDQDGTISYYFLG